MLRISHPYRQQGSPPEAQIVDFAGKASTAKTPPAKNLCHDCEHGAESRRRERCAGVDVPAIDWNGSCCLSIGGKNPRREHHDGFRQPQP
jgi:hypothetical protein